MVGCWVLLALPVAGPAGRWHCWSLALRAPVAPTLLGRGHRDVLVSGSHAVAHEARQGAAGLGEHLAHRLLRVLGERLVEQDVLLEEAVEATLDDLRERGLGLALVARGLLGDLALVL